jgi:hypothetical protein
VAPLVGVARKILAAGTKFRDTSMAGPWGVLPAGPTAATTGVGDVDGGPPWEVLPAGPAVATTRVGDVDGGPPGGCRRQARQRPPSELATSIAVPLGGCCR